LFIEFFLYFFSQDKKAIQDKNNIEKIKHQTKNYSHAGKSLNTTKKRKKKISMDFAKNVKSEQKPEEQKMKPN
jgi:hypothetical protein